MSPTSEAESADEGDFERIAIVGLAGRFPGARDVEAFWRNLLDGIESVERYDEATLRERGVPAGLLDDPDYVRANTELPDIDAFDNAFFGINEREAALTDPQHRLFLECCWHALEDAGLAGTRRDGPVGVFAGAGLNTYSDPPDFAGGDDFAAEVQWMIGNAVDFLATRVAYLLDLTGPAMTLQTACSTSLVAVHHACQSLLTWQCDVALAGGASVLLPQGVGYRHQAGMILSPDGHCRAFDRDGKGVVPGRGVGVVALRRLSDALEAGDRIVAVIRASAINNDGARKVGFTAPSVTGQKEAIEAALATADVPIGSIRHVEAHSIAMPLGDPIEVAALSAAWAPYEPVPNACAIGSVKTNIGHLDAAAGIAGLIKTALVLERREIPPSLNHRVDNPGIDFASTPFHVADRRESLPSEGVVRAAVSSFGIGGTNAHAILETPPPVPERAPPPRGWYELRFSARDDSALDRGVASLAAFWRERPELRIDDVAHTLAHGRKAFDRRRTFVVADREDALVELAKGASSSRAASTAVDPPRIAWLFTGQGAQFPGMAKHRHAHESVFRDALDECRDLLLSDGGPDLHRLMFDDSAEAVARLSETSNAQPALFAVEYASARLWSSRGVRPAAMLGHGIGEYVAACEAGVFSLADALWLVRRRGELMQRCPRGSMAAVVLDERTLTDRLARLAEDGIGPIDLAAVNATDRSVIAGPGDALERALEALAADGIDGRVLETSHAFHSALMAPALEPFRAAVASVRRDEPRVPFVSNVTGRWIEDHEATDPDYWVRHLRSPVRFADGLARLCEGGPVCALELGPGDTLTAFARLEARHGSSDAEAVASKGPWPIVAHATLGGPAHVGDDTRLDREAFAWLGDTGALSSERTRSALPDTASAGARLVSLPGYGFEPSRHWLATRSPPLGMLPRGDRGAPASSAGGGELRLLAQGWRPEPQVPTAGSGAPADRCLLLGPATAAASAIEGELAGAGVEVVRVVPRDERALATPAHGWPALLGELDPADAWCVVVSVDPDTEASAGGTTAGPVGALWADLEAMTALVHALGEWHRTRGAPTSPARSSVRALAVTLLATGAPDGREEPAVAALAPLCVVARQEYPELAVTLVDADAHPGSVRALCGFCRRPSTEPAGRLRAGRLAVPVHLPIPTPDRSAMLPIGPADTVVVTGGLGRIGSAIAVSLHERTGCRLVLLDRRGRDPMGHAVPAGARVGALSRITALAEAGADVAIETVDVTDAAAVLGLFSRLASNERRIALVVHAAGALSVDDFPLLCDSDAAAFERVGAAKVVGLANLVAAFAATPPPGACLVMSSISTWLGGVGHGAYAAANAWMDAFVRSRDDDPATRWISGGWDAWRGEDARAHDDFAIEESAGVRSVHAVLVTGGDCGALLVSRRDPKAARALAVRPRAVLGARASAPARDDPRGSRHDSALNSLLGAVHAVLGADAPRGGDNFLDLGGDSLLALSVATRCRREGLSFMPARLLAAPTLAALAAEMEDARSAPSVDSRDASLGDGSGERDLPLTPFIARYLYERGDVVPERWNVSALFEVRADIPRSRFERAVEVLIERHPALRLRFDRDGPVWRCRRDDAVRVADHVAVSDEDDPAAAAEAVQRGFDLSDGPLFRLTSMPGSSGSTSRLYLVAHHFLMEGLSWELLVEQLDELLSSELVASASAGDGPPRLLESDRPGARVGSRRADGVGAASFVDWAIALEAAVADPAALEAVERHLQGPWKRCRPVPRDAIAAPIGRVANTNGSARDIGRRVRLGTGSEATRRGALLEAALVSALAVTLADWTESESVCIERLVQGRSLDLPLPDVAEAVGCFLSYTRIALDVDRRSSRDALVELRGMLRGATRDAALAEALRWSVVSDTSEARGARLETRRDDPEERRAELAGRVAELPRSDVLLNYRGRKPDRFDGNCLTLSEQQFRVDHERDARRLFPLAVVADIEGEELELTFVYSADLHEADTVRDVADRFVARLSLLLEL